MTLNCVGECCDQYNIQSDGPASMIAWPAMGDYAKNGNYVYKNILDSSTFLFRDSNRNWLVCSNCQCILLHNLLLLINNFVSNEISYVNHAL